MRTPVIYVQKTDFSPFKAFLYIVFYEALRYILKGTNNPPTERQNI